MAQGGALSDNQRRGPSRSVLVVGDGVGVPRLLRHLPAGLLCGIVGAEIRPQYLEGLGRLAGDHGVPMLVQPKRGSRDAIGFVQAIERISPDLIVCDSYSMLLPSDVLAIARNGAVNVHGGLLPEYRGPNPIQWAIIDDTTEAGVTMHFMDAGFDTGPVIARRSVPVAFTDTWRDVSAKVAGATERLLDDVLPALLAGQVDASPQGPQAGADRRRRTPDDGRIDWTRPVREIYNLIRALVSPLPGAFYLADGERKVLDRYLTVTEVAQLKRVQVGGLESRAPCRLEVTGQASNDPIEFTVLAGEREAGRVTLCEIDWRNGRAQAKVHAVDAFGAAAEGLVRSFAASELGLSTVAVAAEAG